MKLTKDELGILQELYTEKYVNVTLTTSEVVPATGVLTATSLPGYVQAITENFFLLTDVEGELENPITVFHKNIVSVSAIPLELVDEIQFELASQANITKKEIDPNDTKLN